MNRAPILIVGDLKIGQSKAIERYVAKRCNMMGNGDEEYAVIDCISEHTRGTLHSIFNRTLLFKLVFVYAFL